MSRCAQCHSSGYCAVDCHYAPWNVYVNDSARTPFDALVERTTPAAPSPFAYIMRFRRWLRSPPDRRDVRFAFDREAQDRVGFNFWNRA